MPTRVTSTQRSRSGGCQAPLLPPSSQGHLKDLLRCHPRLVTGQALLSHWKPACALLSENSSFCTTRVSNFCVTLQMYHVQRQPAFPPLQLAAPLRPRPALQCIAKHVTTTKATRICLLCKVVRDQLCHCQGCLLKRWPSMVRDGPVSALSLCSWCRHPPGTHGQPPHVQQKTILDPVPRSPWPQHCSNLQGVLLPKLSLKLSQPFGQAHSSERMRLGFLRQLLAMDVVDAEGLE